MNSKLRALGLAMIAALALSAVVASGASAKVKHFEAPELLAGESVTVTGEDTGGVAKPFFQFHTLGKFSCANAVYEGTAAKVATEITITPTYSNCTSETAAGNFTIHIDMNGCHYVFTIHTGLTSTGGATTHTHGPVHIACPVGKEITLTTTAPFGNTCTIHIGAQTPTGPTVDYKNQNVANERDVEITWTGNGIAYKYTDGGFFCPNHVATGHDGTIGGQVTVKGYKDTGVPHQHAKQQTAIQVIETA